MKTYILNTSFHMDKSIAEDFERWVRNSYMPEACKSQHLFHPVFTRLLTEVDPDIAAYAIQFRTGSLEDAQSWHDNEASVIKADFFNRNNGKIVYFTTFMEEL